MEAEILRSMSVLYREMGNPQISLMLGRKALALFEQAGAHPYESKTLSDLGETLLNVGKYQEAIESFENARFVSLALGDPQAEGASIEGIGRAYAALGELEKSHETYLKVLGIWVRQETWKARLEFSLG